jgi:serine/threonine protein kinase
MQPNHRFSLNVAKRIVAHILLGLDYLHRECEYAHTGAVPFSPPHAIMADIKTDNILTILPEPTAPHVDDYL